MPVTTTNGSRPPQGETGQATNQAAITVPGWGALFHDVLEKLPDLRWTGGLTGAIPVYEHMLNDAQIEALRAAITLPQRRRRWMIDPNGSTMRVTKHIATDLGLPVRGAKADQPRLIGGFSWQRHLFHVLLAPFYGHYFFEQSGEIDDSLLWHLRKLAPRPPRTIQQIDVAPDGGLVGIRQFVAPGLKIPELISVDRLAAYVWDQEAGNWIGRSMLRSIYREWLVKDELLRVLATRDRRNGMGVPVAEATTPEGDQSIGKAQQVAQSFRAGEDSSVGMPYGTRLRLMGVEGTLPDILADIRYQDEAMAKRFLAMFMSLGQGSKTGARALGDTFVEFFALAEDALAEWVCDTTTLHVIADIAQWNYGLDPAKDPIPMLVSERVEDPKDDVADLVNLVNTTDGNGRSLLTVDDDTEAWVRQQRGLPERAMGAAQATTAARSRRTTGVRAGTAGAVMVPDRPLRRAPLDFEVKAAVDFQTIDMAFEDGVDALIREWSDVRDRQVDELAAAIVAAGGDIERLAQVEAGAAGADILLARMVAVAGEGVAGVAEEAQHQGAPISDLPTVDDLTAALEPRANAAAQLLAGSLSQAASQRAVAVTGTVLTPDEVAADIRGYIGGLSDTWLRDQFNGLLTQSMGTGRRATIAAAGESVTAIYASALLDPNVCAPCLQWDGHEFGSLLEAEMQFPTGGNGDCLGGPRCRCTLVAVHGESPASV